MNKLENEIHYIYKISRWDEIKQIETIYIGQTNNCRLRWKSHRACSKKEKPKSLIAKALKKYGIKNFKFNVIDIANSKQQADEYEIFYINEYKSLVNLNCGGYNISSGGGKFTFETKCNMKFNLKLNPPKNRKIKNKDFERIRCEYLYLNLNQKKLAQKYKISISCISCILRNKTYKSNLSDNILRRIDLKINNLISDGLTNKIINDYLSGKSGYELSKKYKLTVNKIFQILGNSGNKKVKSKLESGCRKINNDLADEIRNKFLVETISTMDLSNEYKVARSTISNVLYGCFYITDFYLKNSKKIEEKLNSISGKTISDKFNKKRNTKENIEFADKIRLEYLNTNLSCIQLSNKYKINKSKVLNILNFRNYKTNLDENIIENIKKLLKVGKTKKECNKSRKLNELQVEEIKNKYLLENFTQSKLAKIYGVDKKIIFNVIHGSYKAKK